MSFRFDATADFDESSQLIDTLVNFAKIEQQNGNDANRALFLKLCIVLLVTKFQVFIETVLEEFVYTLKTTSKKLSDIPMYLRLNAMRHFCEDFKINEKLQNRESYSNQKLSAIRTHVVILNDLCDDSKEIDVSFDIDTKFPIGKTGLKKMIRLFKQIEGKDVFKMANIDTGKINSILQIRHNILHQDQDPHLTEETIAEHRDFMKDVVTLLDGYLSNLV